MKEAKTHIANWPSISQNRSYFNKNQHSFVWFLNSNRKLL